MTDFSHFSQILNSGEIVDANSTFKIYFSDMKFIPARAFQELNVSHLYLNDRDMTFDVNIFEGMAFLQHCEIQLSSTEHVPDFRFVKDSIEVLKIEISHLTSLDGENLQNLNKADTLSFRKNSISFIHPDVFKGTNNVTILDLSYNLLTSIPPKLLDPMKKFIKLIASYNNLLHVDHLFSVTHPRIIYLDYNNITDINPILPTYMEEVQYLNLGNNPIKSVSEQIFRDKIPNTMYLYLDHCKLEEFDVERFLALPKLPTLDLQYNLIEKVYSQKNTNRSAELKLTAGHLLLSNNKIRNLNAILHSSEINAVQITRNQIEYITENDFKSSWMINLQLQENMIRRIDTNTLKSNRKSLRYLDLSSNLIESLNGSVRYLSELNILILRNNSIQYLAKDEFIGLKKLSSLYLDQNQIKAIGQLQNLPQLQYVYMTYNGITSIRLEHMPKAFKLVNLAGNQLSCNCAIQPFILHFNRSRSKIDTNLCLRSDHVKNLHNKSKCPEICSCGCTKNEDDYYMFIDCSSKNLTIFPHFLKKNFAEMKDDANTTLDLWSPLVMDQSIGSNLYIEDRVLGINLENNSLESIDEAKLTPYLTELYLANNKLMKLPEAILDNLLNLKKVSLSGNPWICDCSTLKFKKWLSSNYVIIRDIENVRCGSNENGKTSLNGKIIWKMTDFEICPTDVQMIISISFTIISFIILILAARILYVKYKFNIKVFFYAIGFDFVKDADFDCNKMFDAFLSFSHKDDEFVTKEVISEIEKKDPNVRLCIHYRHFTPGEFIYDNIMNAVQNSKRTVLILSKNFLESEWCLVEFRAAHMQALNDKIHRIVVIKLEELPNDIDPTIQSYLKSTTYLNWEEKYFWNKLLFLLPTSTKVRKSVPRNMRNS